jgi:phosphate transport system substrate-binding protein
MWLRARRLKDEWAPAPIVMYGRNSASGTFAYFKHAVLGKVDYKPTVRETPSGPIVYHVGSNKFGICYSGIG